MDDIRKALEDDGDTRVTDLHVWTIAPGVQTAIIGLKAAEPECPSIYRNRLPASDSLEHVTIEVVRSTI